MVSKIASIIGDTVRFKRKDLGYSLTGFAGKIGVSKSYLSEIENGKRSPSLRLLIVLDKELGIGFISERLFVL